MGYEIAIFSALCIYLFGISVKDVQCREISNCAPVILIMAAPFLSTIPLSQQIVGLLAVFIPLFAVNILTNGFGMGDVKLCAAFGFVLGTAGEYVALFLALLSAVIVGKITKKKSLPLTPFLCSASMTVLLLEVVLK